MFTRAIQTGLVTGFAAALIYAFVDWDIPSHGDRETIVFIAVGAMLLELVFGASR